MTGSTEGLRPVATFSIVAADLARGELGIAVASKFLACGAVVPWASAGAGAVATQSYSNTAYGPDGIRLMRDGLSAEQALARLIADDPDRALRQVGIVDARGGSAAHTGAACHGWAGHRVGAGYACQGNILVGEDTVKAMAATFVASTGMLSDRLTAALAGGEAAGGDRRGRQASALYVVCANAGYGGKNDVLVDLRVDDHPDPIAELRRLLSLQHLYFGSSPQKEKLAIEGPLLAELRAMMRRLKYLQGPEAGGWDEATAQALDAFTSTENLEERVDLDARTIDVPALAYLRATFG
ncbi:MAG TPA: DUF1028 domain-containing protein [Dongiaceae bacterium]|jgi:uncharacterized Ntn-hydrolase superfamily protein